MVCSALERVMTSYYGNMCMYIHTLTSTHEGAKKCQKRPKILLEIMYRFAPMAESRSA